MMHPIYLDTVFDEVFKAEDSPDARDFLKAIANDPKVVAAVEKAIKDARKRQPTGPSPAQIVRTAVLDVLQKVAT